MTSITLTIVAFFIGLAIGLGRKRRRAEADCVGPDEYLPEDFSRVKFRSRMWDGNERRDF